MKNDDVNNSVKNTRKPPRKGFSSNFIKKLPLFKIYESDALDSYAEGHKIYSSADVSIFLTNCGGEDDEYFDFSLAKFEDGNYIELEESLVGLHGSDLRLIIDRLNSVFFHWKLSQKEKQQQ